MIVLFVHSILVAVGGFFGAVCRYGIGVWQAKYPKLTLPVGTLLINLFGSFLLGVSHAYTGSVNTLLFGVGFLGAFTTYSTFIWENTRMLQQRRFMAAMIYTGISFTFGLLFAYAGWLWGQS